MKLRSPDRGSRERQRREASPSPIPEPGDGGPVKAEGVVLTVAAVAEGYRHKIARER
jgi:hypothetical protein